MTSLETVRLIEELSANAVPATVLQIVDGWRLRFASGLTRRANSVWANADDGTVRLAEKLELVEEFYACRAAPSRFQLCPASLPTELDRELGRRGYRREAGASVQGAPVATVLAATAAAATGAASEEPSDEWLRAWVEITGIARLATVAAEMVRRIGPRAAYARFPVDGEALSVGRAVCERGRAGIFAMATRPDARRRGAARAVLRTLVEWAVGVGASSLYLQVDEVNEPARRLYASAGFEPLYSYFYRVGGTAGSTGASSTRVENVIPSRASARWTSSRAL